MVISLLVLVSCTIAYRTDRDIASSTAKGQRLAAEYEALLSGSQLSDSQKVSVILKFIRKWYDANLQNLRLLSVCSVCGAQCSSDVHTKICHK